MASLCGFALAQDVEEALLHPEEPDTSAEEWSTDFDDEDEEEAAPTLPRRSAPVPIPSDPAARPEAQTDPAEVRDRLGLLFRWRGTLCGLDGKGENREPALMRRCRDRTRMQGRASGVWTASVPTGGCVVSRFMRRRGGARSF